MNAAEYRKVMAEPMTLTLTRSQIELVYSLTSTAFNSWTGKPGERAAGDILAAIQQQCPQCCPETYQVD